MRTCGLSLGIEELTGANRANALKARKGFSKVDDSHPSHGGEAVGAGVGGETPAHVIDPMGLAHPTLAGRFGGAGRRLT